MRFSNRDPYIQKPNRRRYSIGSYISLNGMNYFLHSRGSNVKYVRNSKDFKNISAKINLSDYSLSLPMELCCFWHLNQLHRSDILEEIILGAPFVLSCPVCLGIATIYFAVCIYRIWRKDRNHTACDYCILIGYIMILHVSWFCIYILHDLTHTLKNMIFIQRYNFKSSWI